jgi:hypothetical protein
MMGGIERPTIGQICKLELGCTKATWMKKGSVFTKDRREKGEWNWEKHSVTPGSIYRDGPAPLGQAMRDRYGMVGFEKGLIYPYLWPSLDWDIGLLFRHPSCPYPFMPQDADDLSLEELMDLLFVEYNDRPVLISHFLPVYISLVIGPPPGPDERKEAVDGMQG